MRLPSHSERPYLMAHACRFFVTIVIALVFEATLVAKTATVGGVILTLGSDRVQTVWPNARVTLKNLDTNNEVATVSNEVGRYAFSGVLYGRYEIAVTLAGFDTVTKRITIETDVTPTVDFQLVPKGQPETITVNAEEPGVDLRSSSGGVPTLNAG
jgi:Carboxypeptidase regulatory-like domain